MATSSADVGNTPRSPDRRARGQPLRILVADDNHEAAQVLALELELLGNEVRIAHDGAAELELARDFKPEFAFLDIGMPKVHGYQVARHLRGSEATARCLLVAVTGWNQENDRRRARAAGFDRHLVKPVDPAILSRLLAEGRHRGQPADETSVA